MPCLPTRAMLISVFIVLVIVDLAGTTPAITSYTKVPTLYVGATQSQVLSRIACSDPDGDSVNVYIQSRFPTTPCTNCLNIFPCGVDFCLEYRHGVGTHNFDSTDDYLVTIACTDNKESPVTEVIDVMLIPNSPPYFDPDSYKEEVEVNNAQTTAANTAIHDVNAIDDEQDTIFYSMTVHPSSSAANYDIGRTDGIIRSTTDLKAECRPDVTFLVTISDGTNTEVGPMVISTTLNNPNQEPVVTNLDMEIQVPEDFTVGDTIEELSFLDDDAVTYSISSPNAAGLAQFKFDGTSIELAEALDYEGDASKRSTSVTLTLNDGYCSSKEYNIKLDVMDINEPPILSPEDSTLRTCEGDVSLSPEWVVTDEDEDDYYIFELAGKSARGKYWRIDRDNGVIFTSSNYDIDRGANPDTKVLYVRILDKGMLEGTATVTVSLIDCNDNPPIFTEPHYEFSTTECAAPNSVLGRVATDPDKDSSYNDNDVHVFSGSGGSVYVDTQGQVILATPLTAGTVVTFDAWAEDLGKEPGPLTSENPGVVSVNVLPCPTTPPPVTATPTTTASPGPGGNTVDGLGGNLWWIILAALLATIFLALLAYMIWRYCWGRCAIFWNDPNGRRCCKRKPERLERRGPMRKKSIPPVEEPEPTPEPVFIFGFWKERYPNDDYKCMPDNKAIPAPGDMDDHYPHTIEGIEPETTPQQPPRQPKPRAKCFCFCCRK